MGTWLITQQFSYKQSHRWCWYLFITTAVQYARTRTEIFCTPWKSHCKIVETEHHDTLKVWRRHQIHLDNHCYILYAHPQRWQGLQPVCIINSYNAYLFKIFLLNQCFFEDFSNKQSLDRNMSSRQTCLPRLWLPYAVTYSEYTCLSTKHQFFPLLIPSKHLSKTRHWTSLDV